MNKKLLIKIIVLIVTVIVVVFIWLLISSWNYQKNNQQNNQNSDKYPTARDAADWQAPFMKKIEVKFMDTEEKAKMNLADDPMMRLQVLERDADGNVTAYKKIAKDEDIIQYVYDPAGAGTSTPEVATSTSSTTETIK